MAIGRVQYATGAQFDAAGTFTSGSSGTLPTPATAGNRLLVLLAVDKASGTIPSPAGYSTVFVLPGASVSIAAFEKVAAGGETSATVSWGTSTRGYSSVIAEYTGVSSVSAAAAPYSDTARTSMDLGPITATSAGVALAMLALDTWVSDAGFTPTAAGWTNVALSRVSGVSGAPSLAFNQRTAAVASTETIPATVFSWTTSDQASGAVILLGDTAAPALLSRVNGVPASTTARVRVRTSGATSVRLKVGTNAAVTAGVSYTSAVIPDGQSSSLHIISGLTAGTRYYYRVEMTGGTGTRLDTGPVGSFKTAPLGPASFAFSFASCCNAGDSASMAAIAARGDDLFIHTGDLFYADGSGTGVANFRAQMDAKITAPNHASVFSSMGVAYAPNDHDGMTDASNAGVDPTAWTNWNQAVRERFALGTMPSGSTGVYDTWTWGRVRFIQLDDRSFKVPGTTALGATQKQWLKDRITAATEPVIIIIQGSVWIGAGDWQWDAPAERTELANFFAASGKNIGMLAGDAHMLAADDGTNAPGGIFLFHAAPLFNGRSIKGGPYSAGTYPTVSGGNDSLYGRCVVTDTGDQISVAYTGYSSDNTARISLTKTFAATPPVSGTLPTGRVTVLHALNDALRWKGRPAWGSVGTPAPTIPEYGPVSVADINEFESRGLGTPIDANYVMWHWATGTDLHTVFGQLGANDILVLPEDENPYVVNQMYRTSDGTANGANPTTDRSASRSKKGVIGLGPNAIIQPSASFPAYAAQTGNDGVRESLVENWTAGSYHANFTIKGGNVGGLAYHALKLDQANDALVERIRTVGHYGFQNFQPGESFGLLIQRHTGLTVARRCEVDGRNPVTGVREGSGGIHLVRGAGVLLDHNYTHDVRGHGVAHYWRLGPTEIRDSLIAGIGNNLVRGNGINVEVCGTNHITLNNTTILMGSAASGNVGAHLAVVSAATTGTAGAWPLGNTQMYLNNLSHDESTVKVWRGGSGTYGGVPNVSADADFHFTPATPVTYSNFQ